MRKWPVSMRVNKPDIDAAAILADTVGRGCTKVDRRSSALALAAMAQEQGTPSLPWVRYPVR
jgi:hypothetical protein